MTLQLRRSRQLFQQRLRLLQVGCVEPLGEPAVYGGEQVVGFGRLALRLPETGEATSRSNFYVAGCKAGALTGRKGMAIEHQIGAVKR